MRHARADALAGLAPLLDRLRALGGLREKTLGVFYVRSKPFLHFHEDAKGLFADAWLGGDWCRFPATTAPQRRALVGAVARHLKSPDARPRLPRGAVRLQEGA